MSYPMQQDVLFYQRFLKANGFYHDILDGDWGPNTDRADKAFQAECVSIAAEAGHFDGRSEGNVVTLAPKAQRAARKFLGLCATARQDVRIISGTRTYEQQDALLAQGRTKPGAIVTNAKGGQSNHNFGIAWDIGIFIHGQYITTDAPYKALAAQILPSIPEIEWGGDWHSLKDNPHYQLKSLSGNLSIVRADFEAGESYVF